MTTSTESTQILTAAPTAAQPWHAGADLTQQEACPHCQATIPSGGEFCPKCGLQRGTWAAQAAPNAPATATPGTPAPTTPLLLRAGDGRVFGLPAGETIAGRGEVALRIEDSFISRQHAKFTVDGDSVTVTDLGSSNGTFVNETRLEPQVATALPLGASFRLGQLELTLERNGTASAPEGDSTALLEPHAAAESQPAIPTADTVESQQSAPTNLSGWALVGGEELVFALPYGTVRLGRKADQNELVISDGYISGRHCVFEVSLETLSVTDLGSTNGSFINGERLERDVQRELQAGDALRLGQTELVIELSGGTAAGDMLDPELTEPAPSGLSEAPAPA